MTAVRRANPGACQRSTVFLLLGTVAGVALIVGLERFGAPLREWLLSEPSQVGHRVKIVVLFMATVLSAPLVLAAGYLWLLGAHAVRVRELPPPGYRVPRDTPIVGGSAALFRGA
jgi:hypothetical protein